LIERQDEQTETDLLQCVNSCQLLNTDRALCLAVITVRTYVL